MKTSKCLMGVLLSSVLLIGSVFAANTLHKGDEVINGNALKGYITSLEQSVNSTRSIGPAADENKSR